MVRIGLNMIVKNEAHIIHEVIQSTLALIDTYVIVDTGSTDNTIQIIRDLYSKAGIEGMIFERPWVNFGHNRSEALKLCDGLMDYALVMDADDLISFPSNAKEIIQSGPNMYSFTIHEHAVNSGSVYSRPHLFKTNDGWKYVGVVHEYASNGKPNKEQKLPSSFYIVSRRLGGRNLDAKKYHRDVELLEQGLKDEPDNERYMFYLAQSYLNIGNLEKSKEWYKKRYRVGRWYEEAYHSAYKVADIYKTQNNIIQYEKWMQKAHEVNKGRAEPFYELAKFFREKSEFYKSYHYIQKGRTIPYPDNQVLFIDEFAYKGGFDYEASIVEFYIREDKSVGYTSLINYALKNIKFLDTLIHNLQFYARPIKSTTRKIPVSAIGNQRPSSISLFTDELANQRYVTYLPPVNGEYRTVDGAPIKTVNRCIDVETGEIKFEMDDSTIGLPRKESQTQGLEDLRVYFDSKKKRKFLATNYNEYTDHVGIIAGDYNSGKYGKYGNCVAIKSPLNTECEKNWIPVDETDDIIYRWYPLQIGKIDGNELKIHTTIETPPIFSLFRGSSNPIIDENMIFLVHLTETSKNRKYYHCFVELDSSYNPIRISFPFVFQSPSIEYCLSINKTESINCYVSLMDSNPTQFKIDVKDIHWVQLAEKSYITKIPANLGVYWAGHLSSFYPGNAIETYLHNYLKSKQSKSALLLQNDGVFSDKEYQITTKGRELPRKIILPESEYKLKLGNNIPCVLSTRGLAKENYVYLPLDDTVFSIGLTSALSPYMIPWEQKQPIVFWRGNAGGFERPSKRVEVVKMLYDYPNTDAKLGLIPGTEINIDEKYTSERCSFTDFFKYKYTFIIDGTAIASNHMWVFGSGSVPIIISHPENEYWFKEFIKPMEHFVPIQFDLSDLKEKIDWLVANDDEARKIAENATRLSNIIFSPGFQRNYLEKQLNKHS